MPRYAFQCDSCGQAEELARPMRDAGRKAWCPKCGHPMRRDFAAECDASRTTAAWPLCSTAAGCPPEQIPEMQAALHARGAYADFRPNGDIVFESRRHRKQICRILGLHDRQGGYGDP